MASPPRSKNGWALDHLIGMATQLVPEITKALRRSDAPLEAAAEIGEFVLWYNRGENPDPEFVEQMRQYAEAKPMLQHVSAYATYRYEHDAHMKKQEEDDKKQEAKDKQPEVKKQESEAKDKKQKAKDKKRRQKDRKRGATPCKNVDNAENSKQTEQEEGSKKPEATINKHQARVEDPDSSDDENLQPTEQEAKNKKSEATNNENHARAEGSDSSHDEIPPPFGPAWGDLRPVVGLLHHDDNGRSLHLKAKLVASLAAADKKDDEDEMERNGTKAEWERTKPEREAAQAARTAAMKEYIAWTISVLDKIDPRDWTEEERLLWDTHHGEFTTGSLAILWGRIDASYQKKYGDRDP